MSKQHSDKLGATPPLGDHRPCCAPASPDRWPLGRPPEPLPSPAPSVDGRADAERRLDGFVNVRAQTFVMGCTDPPYPADGEGPARPVTVADFSIAATAVANDQFGRFVRATGYRTDAERFGWSFVFVGLLPDGFPPTKAAVQTPWWRQVWGANWQHPEGPGSNLDDRSDHPVVHVSWNDAISYCRWSGAGLPTEAQWECAARAGLEQQPFPWGGELTPGGRHLMNVWQGRFPQLNTAADGYLGTAPVDAFPPNGYGLHNATGNVWEWTADLFATGDTHFARSAGRVRALRGGSYLCHASYCARYRTSARMANTPDSSAGNIGFRCAAPPRRTAW